MPLLVGAPPSIIDPLTFDGSNGFRIRGENAYSRFGDVAQVIGDFNGDGFDDLAVSAPLDSSGGTDAGQAYVIFGTDAAQAPLFDASAIDGVNGFRLTGFNALQNAGLSLSSAGDINGDGLQDIIVGSYLYGAQPGASFVIFGQTASPGANVDLSTLAGVQGFRIDGKANYDAAGATFSGQAVGSAGDFNGDGFDDLIVGAKGADPLARSDTGEVYVIFGQDAAAFGTNFDLTTLDGTNGFTVAGDNGQAGVGYAVSTIGDVNGDGFDDVFLTSGNSVSAPPERVGVVLFGKADGFSPILDLATPDPNDGFAVEMQFDANVSSVAAAGDVNGDGIDDFVLGSGNADYAAVGYGGAGYVIFGRTNPVGLTFDLSTLDGTNGFRVDGLSGSESLGQGVGGAGDVNGDGLDDVVFGGPGSYYGSGEAGAVVIFGKTTPFDAIVNQDALDGTDGFRVNGSIVSPSSRAGNSVSLSGDFNGDGFDDLLMAEPDLRSAPGPYDYTGSVQLVFGADSGQADLAGGGARDILTGGGAADVIVGGGGDDTLTGGGGLDVLRGGSGDDELIVFDSNFQRVDGGSGVDVLKFSDAGVIFDLTLAGDAGVEDIEGIEFLGATGALRLDALSTLRLSETSNTVFVGGDAILEITDAGWVTTDIAATAVTLTNGEAKIVADRTVSVNALVNSDPVAFEDDYFISEDSVLADNVTLDNGSGGDFDPDGDLIFVDTTPVIDVKNGTLNLTESGAFTYTPDADFAGTDTFVYRLSDGKGGSDNAQVTINVIGAGGPTAFDDIFNTVQGVDVFGNVFVDNGFGADLNPDDTPIVVAPDLEAGPNFGRVEMSANGAFVYRPDTTFAGLDTFRYRVNGEDGFDIGTVRIVIQEDDFGAIANRPGDDVFIGDGKQAIRYETEATSGVFADMRAGFVSGDASIGVDRIQNFSDLHGTGFDDRLFGGVISAKKAGVDLLPGFESFAPMAGNDIVFGERGLDRVDYVRAPKGVRVDLAQAMASDDGFGDIDTIFGVEGVRGTNFTDVLFGDEKNNFFQPLRGADLIDGRDGTDLILYDSVTGDMRIDLNQEEAIHATGQVQRIRNIEDVETGVGDDRVIGSEVANRIAGGAGRDFIAAGGGDDELHGQIDDDKLFGNGGDDLIFGNAGADEAFGGAGDDRIIGGTGQDELFGEDGNDVLVGGDDADRLIGGAGRDELLGESGGDDLFGNGGDDFLSGSLGHDRLFGGGGADELLGGAGDDTIEGGDDADRLIGSTGRDALLGEAGDDLLAGNLGDDKLVGASGDDHLVGGSGADEMFGNSGADLLFGGTGDDQMIGAGQNDVLDGGEGDDAMFGGSGADRFVIGPNSGLDQIADFNPLLDVVDLRALNLNSFKDVVARLRDEEGGAVLTFAPDRDVLTFAGVQAADLDEGAFLL